MGIQIYSFLEEKNWLFLVLFAVLVVIGLAVEIYALFKMPNKECEFDGKEMKLKEVPVGFRLVLQGFPIVMGVIFIVSGLINGYDTGKYHWGWREGEVLEASGPVEDVMVNTDEDGNAALSFTVGDEEFWLDFDSELAEYFQDGTEMTVQYGVVREECLLYFIYVNE